MTGSLSSLDDRKTKRAPLRSSIACFRCRKSKIKCDNQGPTGPCNTCLKAGKECQYPDAAPLPSRRQQALSQVRGEHAGPERERKRVKRAEESGRPEVKDVVRLAEEVLSADYLSATIWSQVFDLYRQHFATELPFLHLASLKERMGSKFRGKASEPSPKTNLVLLGILTLTARFHPDVVNYVANAHVQTAMPGIDRARLAQVNPDASAASDYFAQAFLMLGLYEWTHAKPKAGGFGAWMYVGLAIRMAQALRLGVGDKEESPRRSRGRSQNPRTSVLNSQLIADKEIRRRTMFSCFILDRMLACGQDRVCTICSKDLQIQLPCSEIDFDLSENAVTSFLKADGRESERSPAKSDSVLGCFIRLVDIWGDISKFSFAGGRLSEKDGVTPWHEASRFRRLRQDLCDFYTHLPEVFQLSTNNYHRHENHQGSVYVSLHMLGCLCSIMLHREYIPFIAIRCTGPVGPLDEPTFPETRYKIPRGFWEESAEQVFRAAADIVELIVLCGDKLPMSSLIAFAVWTAAFVGIYAHHFPHMDQKAHMLVTEGVESGNVNADIKVTGPTSCAYQTLTRMSPGLNLAATFVKYFQDMDQRYHNVKRDFTQFVGKNLSLAEHTGAPKLSLRLGGQGGGLEEWKVHGLKVVNNGSIFADGERPEIFEDYSDRASSVEGVESHNSTAMNARTPRSIVSGSFTAINSGGHKPAPLPERSESRPQQTPSLSMAAPPLTLRPDGFSPASDSRVSNGYHGLGSSYPHYQHQQQRHHQQQHQQPYHARLSDQDHVPSEPVPDIPQIGAHPRRVALEQNADNFSQFFYQWEHPEWHVAAPGGIDALANNDVSTPQILLAPMDFSMLQQVGILE
ncbi:hypothetical protein DL546_005714 [Coniochaeta pulveracea]|uniref:Zn(2)-C6 fungal-type domain-containing protein n=1 Tax=Coniochaeta pulveracea TaxID=177199 RepID=A0A420Y2W8_9PEZI|nr:hypothetical protein DL546_005714 [Coniochaeta pulveracea]